MWGERGFSPNGGFPSYRQAMTGSGPTRGQVAPSYAQRMRQGKQPQPQGEPIDLRRVRHTRAGGLTTG
jgi:hypothetical protein